jgi:hypothetical protein
MRNSRRFFVSYAFLIAVDQGIGGSVLTGALLALACNLGKRRLRAGTP